jgi:hypothetical protein
MRCFSILVFLDEASSLRYLSFGDVEETYETVMEAGPLQEVF